jgi:hypothetical protein
MRRAWAFRLIGGLVIALLGRAAYTLYQHLIGAHPSTGQDTYAAVSGALALLIVAVFGAGVLVADRESRAVARRMLSEPGNSTVLLVGRSGARYPDGRRYATLRRGDLAMRLKSSQGRRTAVVHRDGSLLFSVERRGGGLWLISTDGEDEAVIRLPNGPFLPAKGIGVFRADGGAIGTIAPASGVSHGVYTVRDGHGTGIGVAARYKSRTWALRTAGAAPPLLRDMAMAFLFESR